MLRLVIPPNVWDLFVKTGRHSQTRGSPRKPGEAAALRVLLAPVGRRSVRHLAHIFAHLIRGGTNTGARQMSAGVEEANLFSSICLSTSHDTGIIPPPLPRDRPRGSARPAVFSWDNFMAAGDKRSGMKGFVQQNRTGVHIYFPRSLMFPVRSLS